MNYTRNHHNAMKVQSVLIPRNLFSLNEAIDWLESHSYKHSKVDVTQHFYRFRQQYPSKFGRMLTIKLHNGIELIIGMLV